MTKRAFRFPPPVTNPIPALDPIRLEVEGVSLARGGRTLVAGLSFALAAGEALLVIGRNGAGKSTLLRVLAGLLAPATGRIRLPGSAEPDAPGLSAHYLGHGDALKPSLTAAENLCFVAALCATPGPARGAKPLSPRDALAEAELEHTADIPVGLLSAGQQRRVALARLRVAARPLWLLDEPTTALDADAVALFAALVDRHRAAGGLVVAATHAPLGLSGAHELRLG